MSRHRIKRFTVIALAIVLLLALNVGVPAFAGESRSGRQVLVGPDEVIPDDLYAAGETITIEGTVRGDLIAAGNEIRINGTVEGDVILIGRTVLINGSVRDDVRIAAYDVQIAERATIGDDASIVAYSANARSGSRIGGDFYSVTRQTTVDGYLAGTLNSASDALHIGGQIAGNVSAEVGTPDPQFSQLESVIRLSPVQVIAPGLIVNETAVVTGTLRYRSAGEAIVAPGAQVDQLQREARPIPQREQDAQRNRSRGISWAILLWIVQQLRRLITLLVFAFLITWLAPRLVPDAAARLRERPWPSLGLGCATEIVFFLAVPILLLLIVGVGLFLGVLTLGGLQSIFIAAGVLLEALGIVVFIAITSWITKIVVAYLFGALLLDRAGAKYKSTVWPLLLGIVLYVIVRAIPILGWLVALAATLFGLGALLIWARDRWWPRAFRAEVNPPSAGPSPLPSVIPPSVAPVSELGTGPDEVFVVTPPETIATPPAQPVAEVAAEPEVITVAAEEVTEEKPAGPDQPAGTVPLEPAASVDEGAVPPWDDGEPDALPVLSEEDVILSTEMPEEEVQTLPEDFEEPDNEDVIPLDEPGGESAGQEGASSPEDVETPDGEQSNGEMRSP